MRSDCLKKVGAFGPREVFVDFHCDERKWELTLVNEENSHLAMQIKLETAHFLKAKFLL